MAFMADVAISLIGFASLMFVLMASEAALLVWDKLYKHMRRAKRKAPRTVQRSKAHEKNISNKSVA